MKAKKTLYCFLLVFLMMISISALADVKLSAGSYLVGKDLESGNYELTCIELEDEKSKDLAVDILTALSGGSSIASGFWNTIGSQTEISPLSVIIKDQNGKEINTFELKKEEGKDISLNENYTIIISNGSCNLRKKLTARNVEVVDKIEMEWGQSKSQILSSMKGINSSEYINNGIVSLEYEKQSISKFTATLSYMFKDDKLVGKAYYFNDSSKSPYNYLVDALTAKYGPSNSKDEDCLKFLDFVLDNPLSQSDLNRLRSAATLDFESWSKVGNTNIIVMYLKSNKDYSIFVYYGQKWDLMEEEELNLNNL